MKVVYPDQCYTLAQAALRLRVCRRKLFKMRKAGEIEFTTHSLTGAILFEKKYLDTFAANLLQHSNPEGGDIEQ